MLLRECSGVKPVMSNMDDEAMLKCSVGTLYLNECPIVSTSVETIKRNLKAVDPQPGLTQELGRAGRQYAEKYHSYAAAQYLFGSIYDKILYGKDVDLMNLFHPLNRSTTGVRRV